MCLACSHSFPEGLAPSVKCESEESRLGDVIVDMSWVLSKLITVLSASGSEQSPPSALNSIPPSTKQRVRRLPPSLPPSLNHQRTSQLRVGWPKKRACIAR